MKNFIDLFAGIGGFRRGMEMNDLECVLSCELNESARLSYSVIHNEKFDDILLDVNNFDKIKKRLSNVKVDIICGGFPCQPFSRSGKREGFKDKNKGSLFFSTMKIVNFLKPQTIILENVKGLLSIGEVIATEDDEPNIEVDKGSTFKDILFELDNAGYNVEWQVINSAHFCSQKRERVFIHAELKSNIFKSIFPLPSMKPSLIKVSSKVAIKDFINELLIGTGPNGDSLVSKSDTLKVYKLNDRQMYYEDGSNFIYSRVHPFNNWGIMINSTIYTTKINHKLPDKYEYKLSDILLSDDEIAKKYSSEILSNEDVEKQKHSKSAKVWKTGNKMGRMSFPDRIDKPSRTLTAQATGRELMVIEYIHNGKRKYRKLTDLEYLRLQGFNDCDYKKMVEAGVSKNQIKKQAGNAVTVNVINEIGRRLRKEIK
ncbi:MAG: DNA cytosine methyltransferase [Firmicutes bacterium]|jgi:DNA (cytosine-5)-methyltransferase 1|nr:DNA cytosine methyltransferase [Bacillota bacterium]